jgi:hypothetical protein
MVDLCCIQNSKIEARKELAFGERQMKSRRS